MRVLIIPGRAAPRARRLLDSAGWTLEPGPHDLDVGSALAAAAEGRPVLFVPSGARVARRLRRILVLHEGSPSVAAGVDAADEAAVASGAEITVLHVPTVEPPATAGSLPAPHLADHAPHDWEEWRREFLERFCGRSPGVPLRLEVATGPPVESMLGAARRFRSDLVVSTWKGELGPGRAERLKSVVLDAPSPVLILLEREAAPRRTRRRT